MENHNELNGHVLDHVQHVVVHHVVVHHVVVHHVDDRPPPVEEFVPFDLAEYMAAHFEEPRRQAPQPVFRDFQLYASPEPEEYFQPLFPREPSAEIKEEPGSPPQEHDQQQAAVEERGQKRPREEENDDEEVRPRRRRVRLDPDVVITSCRRPLTGIRHARRQAKIKREEEPVPADPFFVPLRPDEVKAEPEDPHTYRWW